MVSPIEDSILKAPRPYNRRVPGMKNKASVLVIGNGRVAKHMLHYFSLISEPAMSLSTWSRQESNETLAPVGAETLSELLKSSTHVLLLITDSQIQTFYEKYLQSYTGYILHFSGALEIPGIHGVHPLMTFGPEFYSLSDYLAIPFVTTSPLTRDSLLPWLANPIYHIRPEQKAAYHAYCVTAGNFTTLLWQQFRENLRELDLPDYLYKGYLQKITENLLRDPDNALTGPFARKDDATIQKNIEALKDSETGRIYKLFKEVFYEHSRDY